MNDRVSGIGRLTDVLVRRGALTAEALAEAEGAIMPGERIERVLIKRKFITPADMTLAIAEYLGIPPIPLAHFTPNQKLFDLLPHEQWQRLQALPVARVGQMLTVALSDPFNLQSIDEISSKSGLDVLPVVGGEQEIRDLLARIMAQHKAPDIQISDILRDSEAEVEFGSDREAEESIEQTLESAEGAPVIRMVNAMLIEALRTRASDIHLEAMEKTSRLRYRIDGTLIERPSPPRSYHNALVSRIKIMSDLDIAERRMPQDGRLKVRALGKEVDVRVSILPTVFGEKVVMRMLDKSNLAPSLKALGLDDFAEQAMSHAIAQPHGIILVTGPTGSGKTTTLYSCLQDLNQPDVNIVTAEDPVEYQLAGINQVHVNTQVGLSFASVLRSVLRQDPDIILVGEIRDGETADIAVKAALTGHLVLSTLHTNDAAGAIARMVDMGVPPFLLASSVILAQAQRLFRKLCTFCRTPTTVEHDTLAANRIPADFFDGATVYEPKGCPKCNDIGYKGRGALMEVLTVSDQVREAIMHGENSARIRELAIADGMIPLKEVGLRKVRAGVTSLQAALEVTGSE
ncbi:MAG: Flp pilus assembly complex ATPase component TadA [Lentisphaerae bacterium]|jgi:type IV pilus assembly protein PilB|nr:Flp pilus assembly complex ATPase component TadA [Lentisphaerota bacterium]